MTRPTFAERVHIRRLLSRSARRSMISGILSSSALKWRYGAPTADRLAIVPQDLRSGDASFWYELQQGDFGLAGFAVTLDGESPFDIRPPSDAWAAELHGFAWLRHLKTAATPEARVAALDLIKAWISTERDRTRPSWTPQIIARRLISWISNADFVLFGVDDHDYEMFTSSLADQLIHLSGTWRKSPDGYGRLLSLTALVLANLCIEGHERHLVEISRTFDRELTRQILADGGHVSRNSAVLVAILLDLIPLRQCFATRGIDPPQAVNPAISRMMPMLRLLRLGDGSLARFNGGGRLEIENLSAVLAYDNFVAPTIPAGRLSHYIRIERGPLVMVMDVGSTGQLEHATSAHAGCLSFELSIGAALLFINCGAPVGSGTGTLAAARSTSSHTALCVADQSSGVLLRDPALERLLGGIALRGPKTVVHQTNTAADGSLSVDASHDGYQPAHGLICHRRITCAADGYRLEGVDRIAGSAGAMRLKRDLPFAVRFHLAPRVVPRLDPRSTSVLLELDGGDTWRFSADGAALDIDDSILFDDRGGTRRGLQIVLRGVTFGASQVTWRLEHQSEAS